MLTPDSYLRHIPPSLQQQSHNSNNGSQEQKQLLDLECDVIVQHVLSITEVGQTISLQFLLSLTWADARLAFEALRRDHLLNALGRRARDAVWRPTVVFENTAEMETTRDDESALVRTKEAVSMSCLHLHTTFCPS